MIIKSAFKPLWWLKNRHLQTLFPTMVRQRLQMPSVEPERIELIDGDFLDCFWSQKNIPSNAPLVILLHGMGGNIQSSYVRILFSAFQKMGYRAVLLHFRCAGDEPNRLPRTYHAGETKDLDYFIHLLNQREPHTKKALVGISLGGNVMLKWLGEKGDKASIDKAIAVSVPFDLVNLVNKLNQGFSKIYQKHLIQKLRNLYAKKKHQDLPFRIQDLQDLKTFWEFDEITTAPLHGFSSAKSYYQASSCVPCLKSIQVPTLIIHALDDPFMTPKCLPTESQLSSHVILEIAKNGGHVGFITRDKMHQPAFWLGHRIPEFLKDLA
jgi:predicted alpha/beta-fold hydrolase